MVSCFINNEPVIYHPLMDMLKQIIPMVRPESLHSLV